MQTKADAVASPQSSLLKPRLGSDCVICTKGEPTQSGLRILQVTEALSFHPGAWTVDILLDFVYKHDGDDPVTLRVIHRGSTTATLHQFSLEATEDERHKILLALYAGRFKKGEPLSNTIYFHPRVNCYGVDPEGIPVSILGPGKCFQGIDDGYELSPEIGGAGTDPMFTSYLLPPRGSQPIPPGESGVFRLRLKIGQETYRRLVGDGTNFSVDSYTRLMRNMEAYDLAHADLRIRSLYLTRVKPPGATIEPEAYDIVVFNGSGLGQPVIVKSGSISITPATPTEKHLKKKVLWFLGQPGEFYLKLGYARRPVGIRQPSPAGTVHAPQMSA